MEQTIYLSGDEVMLNDGRTGVLYSQTMNSRNPLARDHRKQANWYFLPDRIDHQGMVVMTQPCTISEHEIKDKTGHRSGVWPEVGHIIGFEERQSVYVAHMSGR